MTTPAAIGAAIARLAFFNTSEGDCLTAEPLALPLFAVAVATGIEPNELARAARDAFGLCPAQVGTGFVAQWCDASAVFFVTRKH